MIDFINSLPVGEVALEEEGLILKIISGSFTANINGISAAEFPSVPTSADKPTLTLPTQAFGKAIKEVSFAAATEEGRPVLTGILTSLEKGELSLVATDGYRLGRQSLTQKTKEEFKIIIPAKTLIELGRIIGEMKKEGELTMTVAGEQNQVVFHLGSIDLVSRLIEGQFPAWQKIIPTSSTTEATLDREELLAAVKIASIFARDSANIVKLSLDPKDRLTVAANTKQVGDNTGVVDGKIIGEGGSIAFNSRYLLDLLSNINTPQIVFEMSGPLNPGVFKNPQDPEFLHVIMPVRVQE